MVGLVMPKTSHTLIAFQTCWYSKVIFTWQFSKLSCFKLVIFQKKKKLQKKCAYKIQPQDGKLKHD